MSLLATSPSSGRADGAALARLFHRTHAGDGARISALLAVSDWHGLAELAHALRGSAGSVGATPLQHAGAALEEALRTDTATRIARCALALELQAALQAFLARISAADADAALVAHARPSAGIATAPGPAASAAIVDRLETLLASGDIESDSWIGQNIGALRGVLGERCASLVEEVSRFRFDEALALLRHRAAP